MRVALVCDLFLKYRRSSLVVLPYDQTSQSGVGLLAMGRSSR
jgi:hypothetical protein